MAVGGPSTVERSCGLSVLLMLLGQESRYSCTNPQMSLCQRAEAYYHAPWYMQHGRCLQSTVRTRHALSIQLYGTVLLQPDLRLYSCRSRRLQLYNKPAAGAMARAACACGLVLTAVHATSERWTYSLSTVLTGIVTHSCTQFGHPIYSSPCRFGIAELALMSEERAGPGAGLRQQLHAVPR